MGTEFFRQAPRSPGVYVFLGEARRVLYVGQSKNLRLRLSYYKNAQPEREPRRIIRLVHQTRMIELQPCETSAEAQAREVELIQEHRPRFNVQHALSRTYSFFGVRAHSDRLQLRMTLDETTEEGETLVGAFKNRGLCRRALFAAVRTEWCERNPLTSIYHLPMPLLDRTKVNEVTLSNRDSVLDETLSLLRGESPQFLKRSENLIQRARDGFLREVFENDHLTLTDFFDLATRMRKLRERSGIAGVLPQKWVDRTLLSKL